MAKRKKDPVEKQLEKQAGRRKDAAATYRAKLSARKAALAARTERWSPGLRDHADLTFARLLEAATTPKGPRSGLRKRFLGRWVFGAATQRAAARTTLHRASRGVLNAARARDPVVFQTARDELKRLWREARADAKRASARRR